MRFSSTIAATTAVVFGVRLAAAQCYNPKGEAIELNGDDSRTWVQCPPKTPGGHSQCCATDEKCTDFGLCEKSGKLRNGSEYKYYYREYCTDKTWNTLACSNVCMNNGFEGTGTVLTVCDDDTICCGNGEWARPNCCEKKLGVQVDKNWRIIRSDQSEPPTPPTSATTPDETATQTSASSTTSSDSPSDTATDLPATTTPPGDSESSNSSISGGAIAGIVVGAVAGVGLITAAAFFWRRRGRRTGEVVNGGGLPVAAAIGAPDHGYYKPVDVGVPEMEVPVHQQGMMGLSAVEMPAAERAEVHEMPGEGRAELRR